MAETVLSDIERIARAKKLFCSEVDETLMVCGGLVALDRKIDSAAEQEQLNREDCLGCAVREVCVLGSNF